MLRRTHPTSQFLPVHLAEVSLGVTDAMQFRAKRVCLHVTSSPRAVVATWMSLLDACTRHPLAHVRFAHARTLAATLDGLNLTAVIAWSFS